MPSFLEHSSLYEYLMILIIQIAAFHNYCNFMLNMNYVKPYMSIFHEYFSSAFTGEFYAGCLFKLIEEKMPEPLITMID